MRFSYCSSHPPYRAGQGGRPGATRGFTIIEMMMVMAFIVILITLAAPSMRTMILTNQVRSFTGDLLGDLSLARSEASKRSANVIICTSSNQSTCDNTVPWTTGWVVFVDADRNGSRNTAGSAEPILRLKDVANGGTALNPEKAVVIISNVAAPKVLTFQSIGTGTSGDIVICPRDPASTSAALKTVDSGIKGRKITLNILGKLQTTDVSCT
jgi:type IV fimbrial biogenesis protein FimT